MTDELKVRQAQMLEQAKTINAGRKPKFGDRMRNPWASEQNPIRDGYFVRQRRATGRFNPGLWYEMTDGKGKFWESGGDTMMFIDHLDAAQSVTEPPASKEEPSEQITLLQEVADWLNRRPEDSSAKALAESCEEVITFLRTTSPQGEAPKGGVSDELVEIGRLIATQDNRITDAPMFIVQQKRAYVTDEDYNDARIEWRETKSGDYILADEKKANELEREYEESLYTEPAGWQRFAVMDVWEFVTACFTEQGCKDYIRINGHNLKETRIYAEGSFRNHEFRAVRNFLLSLATQSPSGASGRKEGE